MCLPPDQSALLFRLFLFDRPGDLLINSVIVLLDVVSRMEWYRTNYNGGGGDMPFLQGRTHLRPPIIDIWYRHQADILASKIDDLMKRAETEDPIHDLIVTGEMIYLQATLVLVI